MDPHVEPPNIDAVEATHVRTSDDDIIDLSVRARIYDQVESRRVHKADIMDAELVDIDQPQQTRTVHTVLKELVAVALDSTSTVAAVEFKVRGVLHYLFGQHFVDTRACSVCTQTYQRSYVHQQSQYG